MRRISWGFLILLILTSGYSALWCATHSKIQSIIHNWKAAEQHAGRVWTCGKDNLGGFPLQMIFTCEKPSFEDIGTGHVRLAADLLQLEAHIFSPTQINFSVRNHLSLGFPYQAANLSFERLNGFINWGSSSAWEFHITGQNLLLAPEPEGFLYEWTGSTVGSIALRLANSAAADGGPRILNVTVDIQDVRPATRNVLTLNDGAVDGKIVAQLTYPAFSETSTYAKLERWRIDGGLLKIIEADVSSNGSVIGVSGALHLDELRRIAGRGSIKFNDSLILANALKSLSDGNFTLLLGAHKPLNTVGYRPLQAHINLTGGKVYVGPIDTRLRLYPLY
jgi:hypothetical protein